MQMNGHHHGQVPPPDHTSIMVGFALRIGRLEGAVFSARKHPQKDWATLGVGLAILASAAAGKVTWSDALPSLLGLVAR